MVLPWSNDGARWQDKEASCADTNFSNQPCGTISRKVKYRIKSITAQKIATSNVTQAQAIANIKNVLFQKKAVIYGFTLPTADDWQNFQYYWMTENEEFTWPGTDPVCLKTADAGLAAHMVVCVGFNDQSYSDPYWIMVNSWGIEGQTPQGVAVPKNRPNGIFRVKMDMDYSCKYIDSKGAKQLTNQWYVYNVKYK
jgi:hypothetical protein